MRVPIAVTIAISAFGTAHASNPGEPLDCSDWVILDPGLTCTAVIPYPCPQVQGWPGTPPSETLCVASNDHRALDNEGNRLAVRRTPHPTTEFCGQLRLWRTQLVRIRGAQETALAYVDDRCQPGLTVDIFEPYDGGIDDPSGPLSSDNMSAVIDFDPISGQLMATFRNKGTLYDNLLTLIAFDGFTTLYEIVQSYSPPSGPLSFRVPAHPEGLEQADHFDTYYGYVADLPDFSKATAMRCDYPAAPPGVGEYLTVTDTSPTPKAGEATYIVTAVNDGAERSLGRQRIGGVNSGRDPTALLGCP